MALIQFTKEGIYCPQADVHIDPVRKVKRALITHGHSDHARPGHKHYLCTHAAKPILLHRLGKIQCDSVGFNDPISINGVNFSFHPAGHIIGSAQIRVEHKGEIWVISGDYKVENDGFTEAFEPIKCDHFITESTFGVPIYQWDSPDSVATQINNWWVENQINGRASVILGYSLGKAQRIINDLDSSIGSIYTHDAIESINTILRNQGVPLKETIRMTPDIDKKSFMGNIIVAPPSATGNSWIELLGPYSVAMASGWMMLRKTRKTRNVDKGFVLSDHADWKGLINAIKATDAENIYVTHGFTKIFSKYLNEMGWNASIVPTKFAS